jgi:RNA polymerase sigma factor (TIGR02999 family)
MYASHDRIKRKLPQRTTMRAVALEIERVMASDSAQITHLLRAWANGDGTALERLTPLVYEQLRRLAHRDMRNEPAGHPLQSTALVHEAYVRLASGGTVEWRDRRHFFAVAARVMRRVLVDAARERGALKRGGGVEHVNRYTTIDFDNLPALSGDRSAEVRALDEALETLARLDRRRAQVVELRFFGGLSVNETAETLDVSAQTVMRDWRLARAWLTRELRP